MFVPEVVTPLSLSHSLSPPLLVDHRVNKVTANNNCSDTSSIMMSLVRAASVAVTLATLVLLLTPSSPPITISKPILYSGNPDCSLRYLWWTAGNDTEMLVEKWRIWCWWNGMREEQGRDSTQGRDRVDNQAGRKGGRKGRFRTIRFE